MQTTWSAHSEKAVYMSANEAIFKNVKCDTLLERVVSHWGHGMCAFMMAAKLQVT